MQIEFNHVRFHWAASFVTAENSIVRCCHRSSKIAIRLCSYNARSATKPTSVCGSMSSKRSHSRRSQNFRLKIYRCTKWAAQSATHKTWHENEYKIVVLDLQGGLITLQHTIESMWTKRINEKKWFKICKFWCGNAHWIVPPLWWEAQWHWVIVLPNITKKRWTK